MKQHRQVCQNLTNFILVSVHPVVPGLQVLKIKKKEEKLERTGTVRFGKIFLKKKKTNMKGQGLLDLIRYF